MKSVGVSPIVRLACRCMARLIQIFALYVIFHGHYSPGGGFQGGALLAAAVILIRIGEGRPVSQVELSSSATLGIGSFGALLFGGVGLLALLGGGNFLQYDALPSFGLSPVGLHYWGILVIELGVALAVMAILVSIFDVLTEDDESEG
ncbi:MnhB domain-containing protein [Pelagicoccus sp. SDUM812002]|uniref:MnhB domain-containing protein n=1 Tax=Pelagicoccus sp. SDUM812002 TaxID=3041266 RepID=UPI00280C62DD|nr:MnhB domain-containing protein [Pelagicoccus sp. SDUM812002]MDQ8185489.1 MnhB domain-containing protein [Pelagicoccus sp. SDUM812002]